MNGINDGGINQFLQRRLNVTDTPAPASTLAPEVMPVIEVQPPSQEDHFLRGTRICGQGMNQAAVAANYSVVILENPANSRAIVLLDWILLNTSATDGFVDCYLENSANSIPGIGAVGTGVLDGRWGLGTNRSFAIFRAGLDPVAPAISWITFARLRWNGGNPYEVRLPITLSPGRVAMFRTDGVNQRLSMSLVWRERPGQPSELA